VKTTGAVEALNVSPKGHYEGFLLRTSKGVIQINIPKDGMPGRLPEPGEKVSAEVEKEPPHGEPQHKVFRLHRLLNGSSGKTEKKNTRFHGRVARLNYALHGEVNGGILDSGDFLHLKPAGAREVGLAIETEVKGRGSSRPMVDGHLVIEADEVNGIAIHRGKKKPH
jgi:hypothetical protein